MAQSFVLYLAAIAISSLIARGESLRGVSAEVQQTEGLPLPDFLGTWATVMKQRGSSLGQGGLESLGGVLGMRIRRKLLDCTLDDNCANKINCTNGQCTTCAIGYYFRPGFICQKCPDECLDCDKYGCLSCTDTSESCCPSHRSNFDSVENKCNCSITNDNNAPCLECNPYECDSCPDSIDCCQPDRNFVNLDPFFFCSCSDSNCSTCTENSQCLLYFTTNNVNCDPGFNPTPEGACVCPDQNCLICDTVGCTRCLPGDTTCCQPYNRLYQDGECIECPDGQNCCGDGFYFDGTSCVECRNPLCATCTGTECLSCNTSDNCCDEPKVPLADGTCCPPGCLTCNAERCLTCDLTDPDCCGDGFYLDALLCTECPNCATCDTDGSCITCPNGGTDCCNPGRYFRGAECIACPANTNCDMCDENGCLTCIDNDETCCTANNRFFSQADGRCCDTTCSTCDEDGCLTCPSTEISCCTGSRYFDNGECLECNNPLCATCNGTECLSCVDGNTTCCDSPKVTVADGSCCDPECASCDEEGCTSCLDSGTNCCEDGFYNNGIACVECTNNDCATCDNSNNCVTCNSPDNDCCGTGRYFDGTQCIDCPTPNCDTCDELGCLTCEGNGDSCCTGTRSFRTDRCCDSSCETCDESVCLTCPAGTECCGSGRYLVGNTCTDCPVSGCDDCDSEGCLTCLAGDDGCCPPSRVFRVDRCCDPECETCDELGECLTCVGEDTTCCDNGTYFSVDQCVSCPVSNCDTCDSVGCLTCIGSNNTCCEPSRGFRVDRCCDTICATCDSIGNCLTCTDNINNDCCGSGRFFDGGQCQSCPFDDCETCNISECLTCQTSTSCCTFPKVVTADGTCCPSNCATCDTSGNCLTCIGSDTECCPTGTVALNGTCTSCTPDVDCCGAQEFYDRGVCSACDLICDGCTGSADNCTNCQDGTSTPPDCETTSTCTDDSCCEDDEYFSVQNQCEECAPQCNGCTGSAFNCEMCADFSTETPPNCCTDTDCLTCDVVGCLICASGTGCCPDGRFHNGIQCEDCAGECLTCDTSATDCITCSDQSLTPPDCCPANANDDDKDGRCECNDGGNFLSDCTCGANFAFIEGNCVGPITFTPVITGPSSISTSCTGDVLELSASNFEVLGGTFEWTVEGGDTALEDFLAGVTTDTITIPVSLLTPGSTLEFTVTLLFFGLEFTGSHTVVVTNDMTLFVFVESGSSTITLADCTTVVSVAVGALSPCPDSLEYSWSSPTSTITSSTNTLLIDPAELTFGTHLFTATVTSGGLSGSTTITVIYPDPGIEAVIAPISSIQFSDSDLVLDGTGSIGTGITYSWECISGDCPNLVSTNMSTLTIEHEELSNSDDFTIELTVSLGGCEDTDQIDITITSCSTASAIIVNPDEDFYPSIPDFPDYHVYRIEEEEEDEDRRELWGWYYYYNKCWGKETAVIPAGDLEPGECYKFKIKGCYWNNRKSATIDVYANLPPVCSENPLTFVQEVSEINVTIDGCSDTDVGLDLSYTATVSDGISSQTILLTDNTFSFSYTVGTTYTISGTATEVTGQCSTFSVEYTPS